MELFCKFEVHEYMDMYPRDHVRTFIAEDEEAIKKEAIRYAQHMNQNYSGGTTRFIKVMTKEEAEAHVKDVIAYEDAHPQEDSEDFKKEMLDILHRCYS
jgi:hypothetical protein